MAIDFCTLAKKCQDGGFARALGIAIEGIGGLGALRFTVGVSQEDFRDRKVPPEARRVLANWRFGVISIETLKMTHTLGGYIHYAVSYGRAGDFSYAQLARLEAAGVRIEEILRAETWPVWEVA